MNQRFFQIFPCQILVFCDIKEGMNEYMKELTMTSKAVYITREIESWIQVQSQHYPILCVMGPRQSGKTEMIKKYFPELPYFDLREQGNA